jgi:hypothetical protein
MYGLRSTGNNTTRSQTSKPYRNIMRERDWRRHQSREQLHGKSSIAEACGRANSKVKMEAGLKIIVMMMMMKLPLVKLGLGNIICCHVNQPSLRAERWRRGNTE